MSTDHSVQEAGLLLIIFEAILVSGHSLKAQNVHRLQVGIHFHEAIGVEKILEPLFRRLRKVIITARADALILRQLDFRHDFRTSRTLLKKTTGNIALPPTFCFDCRFFENGHGTYARAAVAA